MNWGWGQGIWNSCAHPHVWSGSCTGWLCVYALAFLCGHPSFWSGALMGGWRCPFVFGKYQALCLPLLPPSCRLISSPLVLSAHPCSLSRKGIPVETTEAVFSELSFCSLSFLSLQGGAGAVLLHSWTWTGLTVVSVKAITSYRIPASDLRCPYAVLSLFPSL